MTTLVHGDNMIDARRKRVGKLEGLVHGLTADTAYCLCCKYLCLVRLELRALTTELVGTFSSSFFVAWHGICHLRGRVKKRWVILGVTQKRPGGFRDASTKESIANEK